MLASLYDTRWILELDPVTITFGLILEINWYISHFNFQTRGEWNAGSGKKGNVVFNLVSVRKGRVSTPASALLGLHCADVRAGQDVSVPGFVTTEWVVHEFAAVCVVVQARLGHGVPLGVVVLAVGFLLGSRLSEVIVSFRALEIGRIEGALLSLPWLKLFSLEVVNFLS